jgi:hypothetical protein
MGVEPLRPALFIDRRKPNFHRNNDRKLGAQMQGYDAVDIFVDGAKRPVLTVSSRREHFT